MTVDENPHSEKETPEIICYQDNKMNQNDTENNTPLAKQILDKYATEVLSKDAVTFQHGKAGVNANLSFIYNPQQYTQDLCLWKAPNDWIRIEFDGVEPNEVRTLISETASNLKSLNIQYCITYHAEGVSPYINICNIKDIPLGDDNKPAKSLLLDLILTGKAKQKVDMKNLSFTWTPIIGHPHWKPKYNGAVHAIVDGINPLEQVNTYPQKLLSQLKKAQKVTKEITFDLNQKHKWVEDFLLNYCCNNELPAGQRNSIINKNIAILIALRTDKDSIIQQYNKNNPDAGSLFGWINSFLRGDIKRINPLELKKYIIDNKIPYDIAESEETSVSEYKVDKAIKVFLDKKDLAEQFVRIQPLFYDSAKNFWIWNYAEFCWKMVDETDVLILISENSNSNTIESKDKTEIIESLKQVGRRNSPEEIKKTWIQFKDVFVDVITLERIEASPKYFATNPIPHSIGLESSTPTIDKIFTEWVGADYVKLLKQIVAYCMLPDYPIHRIFCFLGSGRNGKSRYLAFIDKTLGKDNVSACELDNLMMSRFEMFSLYKKLAVQMGETDFSTMRRTAILKKLTGQDKVNFESKGKNAISDVNYAKLLISTNNLPESEDKSEGFYRRWLCIDFNKKFPEGRDILETIPQEEYANFCAQCITLLQELLLTGKFDKEGTVEERQKRYEERSNPFEKFVKENCVNYDDEHIFKHEFKKEFSEWCTQHRFRQLTDMQIKQHMEDAGIHEGKEMLNIFDKDKGQFSDKLIRAWRGIGWKTRPIKETAQESGIQIEQPKIKEEQM